MMEQNYKPRLRNKLPRYIKDWTIVDICDALFTIDRYTEINTADFPGIEFYFGAVRSPIQGTSPPLLLNSVDKLAFGYELSKYDSKKLEGMLEEKLKDE